MNKTVWQGILQDDELNIDVQLRYDGNQLSVWLKEEGDRRSVPLTEKHTFAFRQEIRSLLETQLGEWVAQNVMDDPQQLWLESKEALSIAPPKRLVKKAKQTIQGVAYQLEWSTDGFTLFLAIRIVGQPKTISPKQLKPDVKKKLVDQHPAALSPIFDAFLLPLSGAVCEYMDLPLPHVGSYTPLVEQLQHAGYVIHSESSAGIPLRDVLGARRMDCKAFKMAGVLYVYIGDEGLRACQLELDHKLQQLQTEQKELNDRQKQIKREFETTFEAREMAKERIGTDKFDWFGDM